MEQELTDVQKAYMVLGQTLDMCVQKGALTRGDVLNYHQALTLLDPVIFPKEEKLQAVGEVSESK